MSYSPLTHLTPQMGPNSSDNFFDVDRQPDRRIGYDVDQETIRRDGRLYGDYDELIHPHVSGSEATIIPRNQDSGMHEYIESVDNSGEKVYNLKGMLDLNQKPLMDDMIVMGNGRVGDVEISGGAITPNVDLTMVHDNSKTSIKGILDDNAVNSIFFSDMNVKVLNDAMRYGVYQKTKRVIGEQSQNELAIIMRSIMLQYANFQASADQVVEEVKRLNQKVLLFCIDMISSNVLQQMQYLEDIKTLPTPIDHPAYVEHPKNLTYDISNLL